MPVLETSGSVGVLRLTPGDENRFSPDWLDEIETALAQAEADDGPRALVTIGQGKFWSTGLDLDWLRAHREQFVPYVQRVQALFARTLQSKTVTVAALNGHTFAAGAMWALSHDMRVMRRDRGFFCLPEVDLDLDFQPGMLSLVQARLAPSVAHSAVTLAHKFGGEEAARCGIVDVACDEDELLSAAVDLAQRLSEKSQPIRERIKAAMYAETLRALRTDVDAETIPISL